MKRKTERRPTSFWVSSKRHQFWTRSSSQILRLLTLDISYIQGLLSMWGLLPQSQGKLGLGFHWIYFVFRIPLKDCQLPPSSFSTQVGLLMNVRVLLDRIIKDTTHSVAILWVHQHIYTYISKDKTFNSTFSHLRWTSLQINSHLLVQVWDLKEEKVVLELEMIFASMKHLSLSKNIFNFQRFLKVEVKAPFIGGKKSKKFPEGATIGMFSNACGDEEWSHSGMNTNSEHKYWMYGWTHI